MYIGGGAYIKKASKDMYFKHVFKSVSTEKPEKTKQDFV